MTLNELEDFCDRRSKEIAKIIATEYDQADIDVDSIAIEKEIFEASSGYASIFVFNNRYSISPEDKEGLKSRITSRFDISNSEINKMSLKDLVAHLIKSYTIGYLNDSHNLILV